MAKELIKKVISNGNDKAAMRGNLPTDTNCGGLHEARWGDDPWKPVAKIIGKGGEVIKAELYGLASGAHCQVRRLSSICFYSSCSWPSLGWQECPWWCKRKEPWHQGKGRPTYVRKAKVSCNSSLSLFCQLKFCHLKLMVSYKEGSLRELLQQPHRQLQLPVGRVLQVKWWNYDGRFSILRLFHSQVPWKL